MNQNRYIPPHRRRGLSSGGGRNERAHLDTRHFGKQEIVVTLKSKTKYQDLPGQQMEVKPLTPDILCQKFKLDFQQDKLRELMRWFRNIGRDDAKAVLEFPPCLDKGQRKDIHLLANNFGLGTSSQGFGDQRYLCVYTVEAAALGVEKISLTQEEKRKSDEVWFLVKKFGGRLVSKYSHNEISEMILADNLHPDLQDLFDKNQDILADEFADKCKIRSKKE
ncbi:uncharacterized protein LOC116299545 [Actinia tenebrosa]|uniref:Uncharacterized protein LOC116299545 n=1 Tax=Actinia tenebrosa TaxID=6105 RepID=A0A6P8IA80_ACTTE|nr:uncharacterized protein LOC116299545 [Actinia tenebrosa]